MCSAQECDLVPLFGDLTGQGPRFNSEEILFDGQLWGSVRILPVDEIKKFFDVVNHYDVNFHLKE